jgi:hypothetical protein
MTDRRGAGLLGLWLILSSPALALAAPLDGTAGPEAASLDAYDTALAEAREEAGAGRFAGAARRLEAPAASWSQDFTIQLARAYYLLRAGDYPEAARGYRRALALSPDSAEAQRGLDDARAGRGAPTQGWLGLSLGGTRWNGNPARASLGSAGLSLDAVLADHWTIGGTYRGFAAPVTARGGASAGISDLAHEGQLAAGYAATGWSLTLHGAATSSSAAAPAGGSQRSGYGGVGAGLAASLVLGLEWRASVALIDWEDQAGGQVEATAALPIGQHLRLEGGWRGQRLDGTVSGAALAGVAWRGPWTLSLRGELGSQRRPWDLGERTIHALPETLRGALRLQASVPLTPSVRGWLGADLERWRLQVAVGSPTVSTASRLTAGLVLSF